MASQAHLPPQLLKAVQEGALLLSEAWQIQDQFLQSEEQWVEMPHELTPQCNRLALWQLPGLNNLPL